jgi:hypothetical protein
MDCFVASLAMTVDVNEKIRRRVILDVDWTDQHWKRVAPLPQR